MTREIQIRDFPLFVQKMYVLLGLNFYYSRYSNPSNSNANLIYTPNLTVDIVGRIAFLKQIKELKQTPRACVGAKSTLYSKPTCSKYIIVSISKNNYNSMACFLFLVLSVPT